MKIAVFSDTHGNTEHMRAVLRQERPDMVLHLGDVCRDIEQIRQEYPALNIQNVCGNCDAPFQTSAERRLLVEGRSIFMTHGHLFGVKSGYGSAITAALAAEAQILLFGHTHEAYCSELGALHIMNPGSCGPYGRASFGMILLEKDRTLCYTQTI